MTPSARLVLWLCAAVVIVGPLVLAGALARAVPVEWLAWVPWVAALAISWLALAPK